MKQLLASFLLALSLLPLPSPLFANGHGKYVIPDDGSCHARFPHPNPLPLAGEGANDTLRVFHVNEPPPLMLANIYRDEIPLAEYWVSEKLDGMRGYWDGRQLLTRGGKIVHAPSWFTAGWPDTPMDGELWIARGQFSQTVSVVRQQMTDDAAWRKLRFMAFDLPAHPGPFDERNAALQQIVASVGQPWLQQVAQFKVANPNELQTLLKRIVKQGGEGLMLHRGSSLYRAERNDDLLKLKLFRDAEARVVAHLPGKGKYAGMLGALEVESPEGLRFRLGAGFTDAERRAPPPVGSWVSYRYNSLNEKTGIPRFARFLRVRADMNP